MARLYTLQRHELRQLAERPLKTRWDDDTEPNWLTGLVAILAFSCLLAWMDERDNAHYLRQAAEKAHQDAQEARQELQSEREASGIKWVRAESGYVCRFDVERRWHNVFAKECERMGELLRIARK